jgi:ankyrin repeat protein
LNLLVSSVHPANAGVQADLVEILVDAGAATEGPDNDGFPLQLAIDFGYTAAAQMLLAKGARIRSLSVAAGLGRVDALETLLQQTPAADPEDQLHTALSAACRHGQIATAEVLLDRGVDINAQPMQLGTGLHQAVFGEHIKMIRFLIMRGADLSRKHVVYEATPLDFACHNGKTSAVDCLLEYSEEDLADPLLSAVDHGHGDVVQRLLQQGARAAGALSLAQERDNRHVLDLLNRAMARTETDVSSHRR